MKKINKTDTLIFCILLIVTLIIFTDYLTGHFATDTFNIINIGYRNYAINYSLLDGRIFMGIIGLLANQVQIPIMAYVIILQILAIIVSCIVVIILKNIILKYKKINNKKEYFLLVLICYYTIFNFTYIENMYFVECLVMAFSLLFYILSANYVVEGNIKSYIKATLMLFLGLICYQGTISAFFTFVLLFSILEEKKAKVILKNLIVSGIIFIIGFLLNNTCIIFVEKIFNIKQTRGLDIIAIIPNISFIIINYWKILINSTNLYPKYLYIIFIIFISLLVCSKMLKNKNKRNENILYEQLGIIIFSIACAFIPSVINLTGFWSARMRFSLGAIIGLLFIHLIVKTDILERKDWQDKILITIFIIYGIVNSITAMYLINLNKQANILDKQKVLEIDSYISNYEEESNIKVKNIDIVLEKQKAHLAYFPETKSTGVWLSLSSVRTIWSSQGVINYYTGRNLKQNKVNEEERQEYLNKVDKTKDYLCIGDTLYVTVYMY